MTDYSAPLSDMRFAIRELAGLSEILELKAFADVSDDVVDQVLDEAARFASEVWAPLNRVGDTMGVSVEDGAVTLPPGFKEAYQQFVEAGWQSLEISAEHGGMGFPSVVSAATFEMLQSANLALTLCPMLTSGAAHAIEAHADEALKALYLPKLVSGEWTGTMCLTEPQAGSDLAAVTARAVADGDGYRITGTKIYITWGDHEFPGNVVHLVLARLADAPEGVRGISMFLVPKFLPDAGGEPGERNDVRTVSTEHKLGIHGSPTCVLNFGDGEGALGYLVGEANNGLACMFTMMNHARQSVGIQGLAISDRAYQQASKYARDRVQGRAPGVEGRAAIIHHADVRRMLMVMRSQIEAMRALVCVCAASVDLASHAEDSAVQKAAELRMALLTPVVKGWLTETSQELTSLGIQIHGGMGYVEETGAAQHYRDARILTIYEGTSGIQAGDLAGRKILRDGGAAFDELVAELRELNLDGTPVSEFAAAMTRAIDSLENSKVWLLERAGQDPRAAGSASFNLMMEMGVVLGGWLMAKSAVAADRRSTTGGSERAGFYRNKITTCRFYLAQILPRAEAYGRAARSAPDDLMGIDAEDL